MSVKYIDWIVREAIRAEPNAYFVFGDNMRRVGLGGQAAQARHEPNALGVATLYAPGEFYDHDPRILAAVVADLLAVAVALKSGATIYVPRAGLGTGLGRLIGHRPDIHNLIVSFFMAADGEPCPWELV